jgi:nucleoside 2-deoxyribosyltransferase
MADKPSVYLAGPAVFHPAAKAIFEYLTEICATHGLNGVSPLDGAAYMADLDPAAKAAVIRRNNIAKLRACDLVIACISPFRGPGADAGTAWEMGFAEALAKPVVAWCEETTLYVERVPHDRDDDGRLFCKQHGMQVEDFGLLDNLMMTATTVPVQPDFEAAVRLAAKMLGVEGGAK